MEAHISNVGDCKKPYDTWDGLVKNKHGLRISSKKEKTPEQLKTMEKARQQRYRDKKQAAKTLQKWLFFRNLFTINDVIE